MTANGGSDWCTRCHHLVWRAGDGLYLHASDDDWASGECGCASDLTRCVPESSCAHWGAVVRSVTTVTNAVVRFNSTVTDQKR